MRDKREKRVGGSWVLAEQDQGPGAAHLEVPGGLWFLQGVLCPSSHQPLFSSLGV